MVDYSRATDWGLDYLYNVHVFTEDGVVFILNATPLPLTKVHEMLRTIAIGGVYMRTPSELTWYPTNRITRVDVERVVEDGENGGENGREEHTPVSDDLHAEQC